VLVLGLAGCKEKPALGGETNEPEVQTEAKELTELKDRIKADGTVSYAYGIVNSEVLERFEGTWNLDGDVLKLNPNGGVVEGVDEPIVISPYPLNVFFEWEVNSGGLELTHIDGDAILYGTKGNTFEFYENEY